MPFTRPSLSTIVERIKTDFKSGLSLTAILRRSFLDVIAKGYGGASHTLHGHIDHAINEKFFPDTGDEETVVRWGALFNLPRNEATFAEHAINVVGTTGGTLLAGTIYVRADGVQFEVIDETVIPPSSMVEVSVVCQTEGETGNMDVGDILSLQSPIAGIESEAEIDSTTVEGEDLEALEAYRTRLLERMSQPPAGGKVTDYIAFAKKVPGVTRVWVLPNHLGEGTVGLTFVEDDEDPIIPDSSKVDEVQAQLLEDEPQGTAGTTVFAPLETQINPVIRLKPNTTAVRDAVIAELKDMLSREAQVRDAVDPEQVGLGVQFTGKIPLSKINEAISIAAGEDDHILDSPVADVQPQTGGLVTLGTPTFITLV